MEGFKRLLGQIALGLRLLRVCLYFTIIACRISNVCFFVAILQYCTCDVSPNHTCFQWTVLINELDYAKTLAGVCNGTTTASKCTNSPPRPKDKKNATVAKIYVKVPLIADQIDLDLFCLQSTVICALNSLTTDDT